VPAQEKIYDRQTGDGRICIVKTYDSGFAKEVFDEMDPGVLAMLVDSLHLDQTYDASDLPSPDDSEYPEFVWESLMEDAREDGAERSFFVVYRNDHNGQANLLVSPDWPTAEAYAARL
jgi:hypothetical protein